MVAEYTLHRSMFLTQKLSSLRPYIEHGIDIGKDSKPRKRTTVESICPRKNERTETFEISKTMISLRPNFYTIFV